MPEYVGKKEGIPLPIPAGSHHYIKFRKNRQKYFFYPKGNNLSSAKKGIGGTNG